MAMASVATTRKSPPCPRAKVLVLICPPSIMVRVGVETDRFPAGPLPISVPLNSPLGKPSLLCPAMTIESVAVTV
jgi:hypothetical protein